jgi:hypothetical protein
MDEPQMQETLLRNLYRGEESGRAPAALLSPYVLHSLERLRKAESAATILKGTFVLSPLPGISAG